MRWQLSGCLSQRELASDSRALDTKLLVSHATLARIGFARGSVPCVQAYERGGRARGHKKPSSVRDNRAARRVSADTLAGAAHTKRYDGLRDGLREDFETARARGGAAGRYRCGEGRGPQAHSPAHQAAEQNEHDKIVVGRDHERPVRRRRRARATTERRRTRATAAAAPRSGTTRGAATIRV